MGGDIIKTLTQSKALVNFQYGDSFGEAFSNEAEFSLTETTDIDANVIIPNSSYKKDDLITYLISISNTGSTLINNLTITDNLGTSNNITPLNLIESSVSIFINSKQIEPNITKNNNSFKLTFPFPILPRDNLFIIYLLKVKENILEITNNITINATPQINKTISKTIHKTLLPNILVTKKIDPLQINKDEKLNIMYIIENQGEIIANKVTITDQLPQDFIITKVETEGLDFNEIKTNEFSLTNTNSITIPNQNRHINIERGSKVILRIIGQIKNKG